MPAQMVVAESSARSHRLVRAWLIAVAALVFAMVIVGGATRLTDSGLSITEWQPLLGAIPPLGEADWQAAFAKYREIPEYHIVNRGMSLEEFKVIYWWEWAHRFLGRFIGLAFIVPFALLWLSGHIERTLVPRLLALFVIGGLQGALGWFMVMSGLAERVDVSEYRLAAHLTLAAVIYGAVVWVALGIGRPPRAFTADRTAAAALGFVLLVLLQIAAGGFVAGLDAGMGFNTWPLMEGRLIPEGLFAIEPSWRNLFENAMTVQFNHRLLGYLVVLAALLHAWRLAATPHAGAHRASAFVVAAVALAQVALGIATLLHQVPVGLALVHQGAALVLLTAALWHLHRLMVISPSPDRGRQ